MLFDNITGEAFFRFSVKWQLHFLFWLGSRAWTKCKRKLKVVSFLYLFGNGNIQCVSLEFKKNPNRFTSHHPLADYFSITACPVLFCSWHIMVEHIMKTQTHFFQEGLLIGLKDLITWVGRPSSFFLHIGREWKWRKPITFNMLNHTFSLHCLI